MSGTLTPGETALLPKELRFNFYKSFKSLSEYKQNELIYNAMVKAYLEESREELEAVMGTPKTADVVPFRVVSDSEDALEE